MARDQNVYAALRSPSAAEPKDASIAVPAGEQSEAAWPETRSLSSHGDDRDDEADPHAGDGSGSGIAAPVSNHPPPSVSLTDLYRFATPGEVVMLVFACGFACINGALYPCMALVFGHAISAFDPFDKPAVDRAAMEYLAIAVALLVTDYLSYAMFGSLSERQVKAMRESVLDRLLHKDVAWYDDASNHALQLSSRPTSDTIQIKNGMGATLGDVFKATSQCVAGFVIGYVQLWDLALVMSCVAPLSMWSMSYLLTMIKSLGAQTQKLNGEANAVAEETFASMRTVASLNAEQQAIDRFATKSQVVEKGIIGVFRRACVVQAIFTSSVWLMYGVGLWYGGWKVFSSEVPPGTIFQAFFGITLGSWALGMISPSVGAVGRSLVIAHGLFEIIDSQPVIDASSRCGLRPPSRDGSLVFKDVHFVYPSRPEAPVLRGFNVAIGPRETVAFVGPSGGGKSTIVALLERFYDPQHGVISLDGHDLRDLNVAWLRAQIGLVAQEPVLFAMTIRDNIAAGCAPFGPAATDDEVEAASRLANAHEFIMQMPDRYDTFVGENGVALSGGQKQRIAIARAIIRRPRFLVLDEATSALDNESEKVVQQALDSVQSKCQMTTIVIAHRLTTVRSADKIVVMAGGRVAEIGTHSELMAVESGLYKSMVELQAPAPHTEDGDRQDAPADKALVGITRDGRVQASGNHEAATVESSFTIADATRLSLPEAKYYVVGMVAAILHGLALPCSALLISAVLAKMTTKYSGYVASGDVQDLRDIAESASIYGICYLLGAAAVGGAYGVQVFCFRVMAARLESRLRHVHFQSLCRQDIAFFDDRAHSAGALTSTLSTEAAKVALISGDAQSRVVQAMTTLLAAVAIAFASGSWVLTLIMLIILPFVLLGEVIRAKYSKGKLLMNDNLSAASAEASEALNNVRTVMALGLEKRMYDRFSSKLDEPLQKGKKEAKIMGLAVGYSSFVVFATYALVFWYGGVLISQEKIAFDELIRTLMAIIMSAQGVGFAASWAGEAASALAAGRKIFTIRDRPHAIDALRDDEGRVLEVVEGRLELRNVVFRYPSRPEVVVLNHFSLAIAANETVGFCGTSGGGKSTIVALVERFYDPLGGQVLLDGHDLKDLRVSWLRRQIGYVGQEPVLFMGTIAENIAFALDREVSQDEIERAARLANAHAFITQLPAGYKTQVGGNGDQLSGGQKQRVAIARAVLRSPRILILDEATSALDSESEQVVQEALDLVVSSRQCTTLLIAHRLSTLRSADRICVVDQGRVAEVGSHDELVRHKGLYARLLNNAN